MARERTRTYFRDKVKAKYPDLDWEEVLKMLKKTKTLKEIGDMFGSDESTVSRNMPRARGSND